MVNTSLLLKSMFFLPCETHKQDIYLCKTLLYVEREKWYPIHKADYNIEHIDILFIVEKKVYFFEILDPYGRMLPKGTIRIFCVEATFRNPSLDF